MFIVFFAVWFGRGVRYRYDAGGGNVACEASCAGYRRCGDGMAIGRGFGGGLGGIDYSGTVGAVLFLVGALRLCSRRGRVMDCPSLIFGWSASS